MMNWKQLMSSARDASAMAVSKSNPLRSDFEMDYDRIIFSRPFRNLQDKTQVFPLLDQDFVHNRLTHSLEVSSVGRSLGKNVGAKIIAKYQNLAPLSPADFGAVVGAAALAHDVGNPPFGHAGEDAISDFFKRHPKAISIQQVLSKQEWKDLIQFEGNAQGFRLLTQNKKQGLNLTQATLATFSKYPCSSSFTPRDKNRKSQTKYGFFRSEMPQFAAMATHLGLIEQTASAGVWVRHPLTFLVEAADDICYRIIDLEDGVGLGLVSFEQARNFLIEILGDRYLPNKLASIPNMHEKIGVLRAVVISILIQQSTDVFMQNEEAILKGTFDKALINLMPAAVTLAKIEAFSVSRIYESRQVLEKEVAGFEIISGLLEAFVIASFYKYFDDNNFSGKNKSIFKLLPLEVRQKLNNQMPPYDLVMSITDYISGMTDRSALKMYRIITGNNLN